MSDILIKGMELTDRPITLVLYPNGDVDHLTQDNRYETIAKAVEVKPHGRCIDAVALKGSCEGRLLAGQSFNFFSEIDNAPTVLEASNE